MNGGQMLSVRSGRVVAIGRGVMAVFMVASFLLGPATNSVADRMVSALLVFNLTWAGLLVWASHRQVRAYQLLRVRAVVTAVDLLIYTTLLYLTSGADSPFFSPFVMLILGGTIQWGSRGATVLGLLTLLVFAPAGWQVFFGGDHGAQAATSFVLRIGYTAVISVMLVAFARHVERMVEELSRLSDPLGVDDNEAGPPIRECLRHALWVFGAARGMFVWEESDEPYAVAAILEHGRFESRNLTPGGDGWVNPEAADSVFLHHRASAATVVRKGRAAVAGPPSPFAPEVRDLVPFDRVLVIPASSRAVNGWVFVFEHAEPASEDLAVGEMVSAQISVALGQWDSERARRTALAAEDRVRLARDLHDGVLQFLAGARLHLDGLAETPALPADAQSRIATLRDAVADEQRELRGFISTLGPTREEPAKPERPLVKDLGELTARLSRYWSIEVTATVEPADLSVPYRVGYDLGRIVRESVANAVRHGGAQQVRIVAKREDERLVVRIDDNGRGFVFAHDPAADPRAAKSGAPRSLQERVRALNGRLELLPSTQGASLLIDVPLRAG